MRGSTRSLAPSRRSVPREAVPGLEYAHPTARPIAAANGNQRPFSRGDWRQAANNIEDGLDIYFQDRAVSN